MYSIQRKVICLSFCILIFAVIFPVQVYAKEIHVQESCIGSIKVKGEKKVKLSWRKRDAVQYEVYRSDACVNNDYSADEYVPYAPGRFRRIAVLSKRKTSFVDKNVKPNKRYFYEVHVLKRKNGRLKCVDKLIYTMVFTGIKTPKWGGNTWCLTKTAYNAIPLSYHTDDESLRPDGVVFYKKINGTYQKIQNIKSKKKNYCYIDRDVKFGKRYSYKIRTYRIVNGKKKYSKYSPALKLYAVNYNGEYELQVLTEGDREVSALEVSLTPKEGVGNAWIMMDGESCYSYRKDKGSDFVYTSLKLVAYGTEYGNWIPVSSEHVILRAGTTTYLKFEEERSGQPFYFAKSGVEKSMLWGMWVKYAGMDYLLEIDFLKGSAVSYMDEDMNVNPDYETEP